MEAWKLLNKRTPKQIIFTLWFLPKKLNKILELRWVELCTILFLIRTHLDIWLFLLSRRIQNCPVLTQFRSLPEKEKSIYKMVWLSATHFSLKKSLNSSIKIQTLCLMGIFQFLWQNQQRCLILTLKCSHTLILMMKILKLKWLPKNHQCENIHQIQRLSIHFLLLS